MLLVLPLCAVSWCRPAFGWRASCVCLCLWHRARISALSHQQSFLDQCSRSQMIRQFRKILNRQVCYTDSLPAPISALGRRIHTVDTVDVKQSDIFQVLWMKCTFIEGSEKDGLFFFFSPLLPSSRVYLRIYFSWTLKWIGSPFPTAFVGFKKWEESWTLLMWFPIHEWAESTSQNSDM